MKLVNPRMPNIARAMAAAGQGATAGGEDGALIIAPAITPTFTFAEPLQRERIFQGAVPTAVSPLSSTYSVNDIVIQNGVSGGVVHSLGAMTPGLWRITVKEELLFTGTSNTGSSDNVFVLPQQGGVSAFDVVRHLHLNNITRSSELVYDLTLDQVASITLATGATIAGDILTWVVGVLAQRIF